MQQSIAKGDFALSVANHGRRETWGTDPLTGTVREVIHLPGNTWLPFFASVLLAIICITLLIRAYLFSGIALLLLLANILRWAWENGAHPKAAPDAKVMPEDPPLHSRTFDGPGLWGMGISLLADSTLFISLLFGWFYLWTAAPQWQAPEQILFSRELLFLSGFILTLATLWFTQIIKRVRKRNIQFLQINLWGISLLGLIHTGITSVVLLDSNLHPTQTSHDAVITVMLLYQIIHSIFSVIMAVILALRVSYGYIGKKALYEPVVVERWWTYTLATFWLIFISIVLFPMSMGG